MFSRVKYIITDSEKIIVFSELQNHSDFRHFNPVRAGFISIGVRNGELSCSCYGKSISLGMESDPKKDTEIAKRQLNIF